MMEESSAKEMELWQSSLRVEEVKECTKMEPTVYTGVDVVVKGKGDGVVAVKFMCGGSGKVDEEGVNSVILEWM